MNKEQRKRLDDVLSIIEEVIQEEDDKLCNMEESFSETEKYQQMEEKKDELQEAYESLERAISEY